MGSSAKQVRSPVPERVHQCDQLAVDYSALIQITRELHERALDDCDSFMSRNHESIRQPNSKGLDRKVTGVRKSPIKDLGFHEPLMP